MNPEKFIVEIPADVPAVWIGAKGEPEANASLAALVGDDSINLAGMIRTLASLEDGSHPLKLRDKIHIAMCMTLPGGRLITLKVPSQVGLETWLETAVGEKAGILADVSGRIYSVTDSARKLFAGFELSTLDDFLDGISKNAFLAAAGDCIRGKPVQDFSILTKAAGSTGRKSRVMSVRKAGPMNELLVVSFMLPSMSIKSMEYDVSKFADMLFSNIGIPAIFIDENCIVSRINRPAATMFRNDDRGAGSNFIDWVDPDHKNTVCMLLKNRFETVLAPFRFRINLKTGDDSETFNATCALLPDRKHFLLFLVPADGRGDSSGRNIPERAVDELVEVLHNADHQSRDYTRTILEFLRAGSGAIGVSFVSRSKKVTVGEAFSPLLEIDPQDISGPTWTEEENGYSLTIPTGVKQGGACIRMTGLPSKVLTGLGRLILEMTPLFGEYIQTIDKLDGIFKFIGFLSDFLDTLQEKNTDVEHILGRISSAVGADFIVVHTVSDKKSLLEPLIHVGTGTEPGTLRLDIPSIAAWAYTHSEICYVPDTATDQRYSIVFSSSRSEMSIPIRSRGETIGTLTMGSTMRNAFGYPVGSILDILAAIFSLWFFRREGENGDDKKDENGRPVLSFQRDLDDLLMHISHRLNSSISTLRGNLDMLPESGGDSRGERGYHLEAMKRALTDLTEFSERILNLLKMELGKNFPEVSWLEPCEVISSLMPIFTGKGESHGVTVSAEYPEKPFDAYLDRTKLEQILINLVDNAVEYNKPGGHVKITVKPDSTGHWLLEVFNTGDGIRPEDLPKVFDRFYTSATGKDKLGVGLSIVKNFTSLMGGTINVRSRHGFGTWFTLRFPVS